LKRYKSPGINQISEELIEAGREMLSYEIHKRINSMWYKEDVPKQWNFKGYISPDRDQIPKELIQAGGEITF
jgi:hypothetical protein